jgi:hypothetical protein
MAESEYLLTNADPATVDRFGGLERTFDDLSIAHLARAGLSPGGRCLEIGAGGGSIARWMAGQVGASGRVLALDLDSGGSSTTAAPSSRRGTWTSSPTRFQRGRGTSSTSDSSSCTYRPGSTCSTSSSPHCTLGGWIVVEDYDTAEVRTTDRDGPDHELLDDMVRAFNGLPRLAAQRTASERTRSPLFETAASSTPVRADTSS